MYPGLVVDAIIVDCFDPEGFITRDTTDEQPTITAYLGISIYQYSFMHPDHMFIRCGREDFNLKLLDGKTVVVLNYKKWKEQIGGVTLTAMKEDTK